MAAEDRVDGRLAAYREGVERLVLAVTTAVDCEADRTSQLSAGLQAALDLLAAEPQLARRVLVEPLGADHPLRLEHERSLTRLAQALPHQDVSAPPAPAAEEKARLVTGGLVSYLSGRVVAGEAADLPACHQFLLPYLLSATGSAGRPCR